MDIRMTAARKVKATMKIKSLYKGKYILAAALLSVAAACASPEERVEKYSQEGMEFLEEGKLGKANVQFQNALKIDEEHIPSLIGMSKIAEERQNFKKMFGLLQRIVRLDPNQVESRVNLGKLYLIGSDETSALEQAEAALALEPENGGALALKAAVQLKLGDYAGAVELARSVLEKDPANSEAVTVLATERSLNDDLEGAVAIIEEALAVNPEAAILQLLRIQMLQNLGRDDDVTAAFAELIEIYPDQAAYRRAYANQLLRDENYEETQKQLEAIVELDPENVNAKVDVVRLLNAVKGAEEAEAALRAYVDAEPDNTELQFALIDFFRRENKLDEANKMLDRLAASDDLDVSLKAKNKIVTILFQKGEGDSARAVIEEILGADNRNTEALIKRAGLLIEGQDYDAAIVDLRTAIDNSPDSSNAMVLMATAFERQGNTSFAQSEYAKAFEVSQSDPKVANVFAKFLVRNDNQRRAEEVLVESLAANPGDVDNLKLLAAIRLTMQDWRGAEEVAKILEDIAEEEDVVVGIRTAAFTGLEDYDGVIKTLTERNEDAPLESRPLATLIGAYMRSDRADEAEQLLTRIIGADSDNYTAHILLAQVYGAKQENDKAESILTEAAEKTPDRPEAYELLYRYYLRTGQDEKALALIDEGLSKAPENVALRVFKADAQLSAGKREEAFAIYAGLVEERPNDRIIANNFVSLSSDLRQDEASVKKALEISKVLENDENPYFKDTIGWAHYRAGGYEKAVAYLTEAVDGARGNAEFLYHLGAAQLAAGDTEKAKTNLENALKAGGTNFRFNSEVQELLGQL